MTPYELMAEAVRLAKESVTNDWGGPFGAVIARKGRLIATGQNRVLLTGDVTAHAEIEAIRKAVQVLNTHAPSISRANFSDSTLQLTRPKTGSTDAVPQRAKMLMGLEIYSTGEPCPMCLGAIYWARLEACYFGCGVEATRKIGFDDGFLYEDLARPHELRGTKIEQMFPELCEEAYAMWTAKSDRHFY